MKTNDKTALLVQALERICADIAAVAALLESNADPNPPDTLARPPADDPPEKVYTYEEARAILAEKSQSGLRAEVKAILAARGVNQLSDVTDPKELAAIVEEASVL